jgi:hypothetical protein
MTLRLSTPSRALALLLAAWLASPAVHAGDWRQARVRSVGPRADIDSAVDLECAPQAGNTPASKVMVVSYRVGKSLRWRAFNVAANDAYAAGDEVIVNVAACLVARQPQPTDVAASAP